jgi:hypothetical protein
LTIQKLLLQHGTWRCRAVEKKLNYSRALRRCRAIERKLHYNRQLQRCRAIERKLQQGTPEMQKNRAETTTTGHARGAGQQSGN